MEKISRQKVIELVSKAKQEGIFISSQRHVPGRGLYLLVRDGDFLICPESFPDKIYCWCCSFDSAYEGYSRQLIETATILNFNNKEIYLLGHRNISIKEFQRLMPNCKSINDVIFRHRFRGDLRYDACQALESFAVREMIIKYSPRIHLLNCDSNTGFETIIRRKDLK